MRVADIITEYMQAVARHPPAHSMSTHEHVDAIIKLLRISGFRIVPEIPTDEMFKAASEFDENSFDGATKVWRAMLEAANE